MSLRPTALGRQVRVSFSGGMNPASPRALRATLPLGRMVSHVMLPLFRPIRSHPSGGNCRALPQDQRASLKRIPRVCVCVSQMKHAFSGDIVTSQARSRGPEPTRNTNLQTK